MASIDVETLLAPASEDPPPCGQDLEYDRAFVELERIAVGKPERQMGSEVTPAEDPDWKVLAQQAQALLGRTKDLRVAAHLAKAQLRLGGLNGFADGVRLVRGLLERYWDGVHPQLDPDDGDPTARVNALLGLGDPATVAAVRLAPLVDHRLVGRFNLRDILSALGEYQLAEGQSAPDIATIEAAFDAVEVPALTAIFNAINGARDDLSTIESLVGEKVGSSRSVSMSKLSGLLDQAHKHVATRLERRVPAAEEAGGETNGASPDGAAGGDAPRRGGAPGQIRSREDVVRTLDLIMGYYQRAEPSSPVPLLLNRAKKLATMSFVDIVKDMVPGAMSQIQVIGGSDVGGGDE
jgi:type VI secretion system protein ImpA